MTSKVFTAGVVIDSDWLNDVNNAVYPVSSSHNTFSGDGTTLSFPLLLIGGSTVKSWVFVNGVYQQKGTYSLVNNVLIFTEAPPYGVDNIEIDF